MTLITSGGIPHVSTQRDVAAKHLDVCVVPEIQHVCPISTIVTGGVCFLRLKMILFLRVGRLKGAG